MYHLKKLTPIVFALVLLSACVSAPNKNYHCTKIKSAPTVCQPPENIQFMQDFIEASDKNAKARADSNSSKQQLRNPETDDSDHAVGFFSAIFQMIGRLFD